MHLVFSYSIDKTKVQSPLITLEPAQESQYHCDFDELESFLYCHLAFD